MNLAIYTLNLIKYSQILICVVRYSTMPSNRAYHCIVSFVIVVMFFDVMFMTSTSTAKKNEHDTEISMNILSSFVCIQCVLPILNQTYERTVSTCT